MSATDLETELRSADSIEAVWGTWICSLEHWERRFVFENELEFHDLFVSGEWSWADLNEVLNEHFT
jgi:hypothetical protein